MSENQNSEDSSAETTDRKSNSQILLEKEKEMEKQQQKVVNSLIKYWETKDDYAIIIDSVRMFAKSSGM